MATIKDVAYKAGVTVTTVSRILNNRGYIGTETRQKVNQAMEELNYQPNEVARSLFRKKTSIIGLIIPTASHPFFGELAGYIEQYAYDGGYKILLCNSRRERRKEKDYIEMLKRNKVDGIIMASHSLEVNEYLDLNMPIVTFDRKISDTVPFVSSDNYEGGRIATEYLIGKGCRKLALICGNLNLDMLSNLRHAAFVNTAESRGVEHRTTHAELDVFGSDRYEEIITGLFREHSDIDGVFASGDLIAAHTIQVLRKMEIRVPEDVRIVGYDDIMLASLITPQITTIKQPIEEIAQKLVEITINKINGTEIMMGTILPVSLVERGSA
jgi:LacI family transcriptional regulator, sucrose operon repressor